MMQRLTWRLSLVRSSRSKMLMNERQDINNLHWAMVGHRGRQCLLTHVDGVLVWCGGLSVMGGDRTHTPQCICPSELSPHINQGNT